MRCGRWLLRCLLVVVFAQTALSAGSAQDSQSRYIAELKQRNVDYGAGCDGIGVSVPTTVEMPAEIDSRWVAGHSACVPGMRLIIACSGEVAGDDRVIGCTLRVADGEAAGALACDRFTLLAPGGRFAPDPGLSDVLSQGSGGSSRPCADPAAFAPDLTMAAAFVVPAAESRGDLAVLVDVDGSEIPAFLIPAAQLGMTDTTGG